MTLPFLSDSGEEAFNPVTKLSGSEIFVKFAPLAHSCVGHRGGCKGIAGFLSNLLCGAKTLHVYRHFFLGGGIFKFDF